MEFTNHSFPPRPSTASSSSRPGTSSGRRYLSSSSVGTASFTVPAPPDAGLGTNNSTASKDTLNREVDRDELLRIMNQSRNQSENEALIKSEQGDLEGLRSLLANGLDVSCRGFHGYTLLHHAASRGHCKIIAELVRHRMLPIDIKNDAGETPLHLAAYNGHLLAVDQLLDNGANINEINNEEETCLFYAARKSTPVIVRLLIQRGADVQRRDKYDDLAVDHATNPLITKAFEQVTTFQHTNDSKLSYDCLMRVYAYLEVNDILRVACVCSKWHRVSENDLIWKALGVRRWELALQSSLGFAPTTTSSFLSRPKSRTSSSNSMSRNSSNRASRSNSFNSNPNLALSIG